MMQVAEVPFGEWLPDAPDYKNPGCLTADGVYPDVNGYRPFLGANAQGLTTTEMVQGAAQFYRSDSSSVIVGGSSTRLFVIAAGAITETSGYTAIGAEEYWRFARFNDYVVAVAPNNAPQYLTDIDTDTTWSALPGSPPQAKVAGRVGNFLVLGNLTALSLPYSIQWSAENDPTDWPTPGTRDARLKQSGRAALQAEYGAITGLAGDRYPLVFQEHAVSRIDPVGPPTVFQLTTISEGRGCIAPGSIVTVGFATYFLSHDGFWVTNGADVAPIGSRRVNKWFFENASQTDLKLVHGIVDWQRQAIIWAFYTDSSPDTYRKLLVYSWEENRWSTATLTVDYLVAHKIPGVTLEGLDALFPSGLETVSRDLDSAAWKSKATVPAAFIPSGAGSELAYLNGSALQATFETADAEPAPGRRVAVKAIYPIVENADENTTAALVTRQKKGGPTTTGTFSAINAAGFCPVRGEGRFVRAKMVIPSGASWDRAQGVQIEYRVAGRR